MSNRITLLTALAELRGLYAVLAENTGYICTNTTEYYKAREKALMDALDDIDKKGES